MPKSVQKQPVYIQIEPSYLVRIPFVSTDGQPTSPYEYNNIVHAAVHSILAAMMSDKIEDVRFWLRAGRRQLSKAILKIDKPNAAIVPRGNATTELPAVAGMMLADRSI